MNKKIKIWCYGKAFAGKTTFAETFPKPFHINTDGNAEFVTDDFAHVTNIDEFSKEVDLFFKGNHDYETLIIDVNEHIYEMVRLHFLDKEDVDHESDVPYGKMWTIVKEGYIALMLKIFANTEYNIVVISHEQDKTEKSPTGKETTYYSPSLAEKLHDRIAGRVHFVCRMYTKTTIVAGERVNQYKLSIGSTSGELSGQRLPVKKRIIDNPTYEKFIENLEIKK